MLLRDKVAIITGSSKGIGRGIALRFAREGARVVVNGRNADEVHGTAEEIRALGGTALEAPADVTVESEVERMFQRTVEAFGTVHILVNNAFTPVPGYQNPFLKLTSGTWDSYVSRNLGALFYCTSRAAHIMAAQRHGSIINISSNAAVRPHRLNIPYDSVKGAMDVFSMAVAVDLAPWNVRVNVIRPGMIDAQGYSSLPAEERARREAAIPLGRVGLPEDVAWAAVFLAADDAGYITGQAFQVDGGLLVQGRAPSAEAREVVTPENIDEF